MIDLEKLSKFNINDIKIDDIIKLATEHQNTLIKIAIVVGSLYLLVVIINDHRAKVQDFRNQTSQAQDKLAAIKARDQSAGDLSAYQSTLPKEVNEFDLIGLISNYAKSNHVNIPSLSPSQSKDMGLYDEIDIAFQATADNFKDMVLFLRKLEKSTSTLRVDSWSGQESDNGQIVFNVTISSVHIHP